MSDIEEVLQRANEYQAKSHHWSLPLADQALLVAAYRDLDTHHEDHHEQPTRCEYDDGRYLHGGLSICVGCRVRLEARVRELETENERQVEIFAAAAELRWARYAKAVEVLHEIQRWTGIPEEIPDWRRRIYDEIQTFLDKEKSE